MDNPKNQLETAMKSPQQYRLFGATGPPEVAPSTPAEPPGNLVFPPCDWAERIGAFDRGRSASPLAFALETETPRRGPETARCPIYKTGERFEQYETTRTDRYGLKTTVRVTIRTAPMPRRLKRQLQHLSE